MAIINRARNVDAFCGFGKENAWGTAVAAAYYAPLLGQSLSHARGVSRALPGMGLRHTSLYLRPPVDPNSGGWSAEIWQDEFAPLMAYVMGADSVAAGSAINTHTISKGATIPSVTVRKGVDFEEHIYTGFKANTLTVTVPGAGAIPYYDISGVSKSHTENETPGTPSFTTQQVFAGHNITTYMAASSTARASVSTLYFPTSLTMSINNNIIAPKVPMGQSTIQEEQLEGNLLVTGTLTFETFDNSSNNTEDLFEDYKNGTAKALRISFSGANSRNFESYFPNILIIDSVPNSNGRIGPIGITFDWMAFYDNTILADAQFIFQDAEGSAYV